MFLSKLRKSFLPAGLCMVITQGCGPSATNEAAPIPPIIERKSGFPFSIKEPEIYQGDIVINGRDKDRVLIARKGARFDAADLALTVGLELVELRLIRADDLHDLDSNR